MRCLSCDCALNDYESTRKYPNGTFVDLCNRCFSYIKRSVVVYDRPELEHFDDEVSLDYGDNDEV